MKPDLRLQIPSTANAEHGFEKVILRLVKGGPERLAIETGQIDAIVDTPSGNAILLPEAQQAVLERKARFRSLLALSSDWYWEQDQHCRFALAESAGGERSGFDLGHIIGKTLWELPFDNLSDTDWQAHRTQLQWRATFHDFELRYLDRNGAARWISLDGEPIFDEQEQFKGYRGTARDITERKHAEAARQESTRFARATRDALAAQISVPGRSVANLGRGASTKPAANVVNSLLASLPAEEYQRLLGGLEPVTLTFGEVLYEPGAPILHAYFPINCLVSLLTTVEGHQALEVGLVGHEGMVSTALALGINVSPARALVQATGTALRMEAARFRDEFLQSIPLQQALYRYTHALMAQIAQTAACNRFHSVEERLARWLLMTRDRVRSNEFRLTHELLADMLGVRRVGVTNAASALRKRKLIKYGRGEITILDRKRLSAACCECYQIIRRIYHSA